MEEKSDWLSGFHVQVYCIIEKAIGDWVILFLRCSVSF